MTDDMQFELEPGTSPEHRPRDRRHLVCIAAQVESEESQRRSAVTWDISSSGILLLTRSNLSVGDPVKVLLHLPDALPDVCVVEGKVVRAQRLDRDRIGLWSNSVAIQLDAPARELGPRLRELSEVQAEVFGPSSRSPSVPANE